MKKAIILSLCVLLAQQVFSQVKMKDESPYGKNLITVAPFYGYASPEVSDVCVGVTYERFVNDYLGVQVPINFGLYNNLVQTGVAAKFYPFGNERPVKYSIAPTLLYGTSSREEVFSNWDSNTGVQIDRVETRKTNQFGFMLTSALNVTLQKRIYVGMATGLGMNYINRIQRGTQGVFDDGPNVNFMFNISLGYRF